MTPKEIAPPTQVEQLQWEPNRYFFAKKPTVRRKGEMDKITRMSVGVLGYQGARRWQNAI
jgi:hypothetical protein